MVSIISSHIEYFSYNLPVEKILVIAVVCSCFCGFVHGCLFTTVITMSLFSNVENKFQSMLEINKSIAYLFLYGEVFGSLLGYKFADNIGRKLTMNYFLVFTALLLIWSIRSDFQIITTTLLGFSVGVLLVSAPIFISETASTRMRGKALTAFSVSIFCGSFFANLVGVSGWKTKVSFLVSVSVVVCVVILYVPESPRWLLSRKTPVGGWWAVNASSNCR